MIDELKINTIYIISKGRPQCTTAKTLERIGYKGEWFIVCGNNDETLQQYKDKWGDHVLVFDWYEEIKHTDVLDNFGFDNMASGACPVRNATREISKQRGENRHWQFDDDYGAFSISRFKENKNVNVVPGNVDEFERKMYQIAEFAYKYDYSNAGFCETTVEGIPCNAKKITSRVFNAHNLPSQRDDLWMPWVSRLNDDTINAMNIWHAGLKEIDFKFIHMNMKASQQEKGGLTELYKDVGTVRKTAYAILSAPSCTKLVIRFGRYHHDVQWKYIVPKMIDSRFKKG